MSVREGFYTEHVEEQVALAHEPGAAPREIETALALAQVYATLELANQVGRLNDALIDQNGIARVRAVSS